LLLRIDMPGLSFEELDLRFDHRSARLSFRPDALDDLIAWNELEPDDYETVAPHALHDILMLCYAHWRNDGGTSNGAMEAVLSSTALIRLAPLQPLLQPLLHRLSQAAQSWLGLLDWYEEAEPA